MTMTQTEKEQLDYLAQRLAENLHDIQNETLVLEKAAEYIGISPKKLSRMSRENKIPCHKVGALKFFKLENLKRFMNP